MFTTTNTNATAASTAASAGVCPSFSIINNGTNHPLVTSTAANSSWRLTSPSVVSIINGNQNGISMPTSGNILYIGSQPCTTATTNLLQSSQTVRRVSPSLTMINQTQTHIIGQSTNILAATLNQDYKPGICIDTPSLIRLPQVDAMPIPKPMMISEYTTKVEEREASRARFQSI